ncbi:hypothetical protein HUT19_40100 [Streptomyces sp. NA02950]|uniref:hypothetical protein n=1 Tax=Streptomyces sp. NA02950 TaxID=2742137 RepID=UPI00159047E9|nr:hypothetical protein [Streptomyces sp. NA02950]QKV97122.1 hypothetical protein HUT19_40100 [Streptomyces sp. NA02950]
MLGLGILSSTLGELLLADGERLLTQPEDEASFPTWLVLGTLGSLVITAAAFAVAHTIDRRRSRTKIETRLTSEGGKGKGHG